MLLTTARGFDVSVESPRTESVSLFRHGERTYDHLILLPPKSKALGPKFTPEIILDFIEKNGNVVVGLSGATSTPLQWSTLLSQFDIHLPQHRTSVTIDHFNYDAESAPERHDVLTVLRPQPLRDDTKNYFGGDGVLAVPRPVGHYLGNSSPLIAPILTAPESAYTFDFKDASKGVEDVFAPGTQTALVTALQARNQARVTVLGSAEMLQNEWFESKVRPVGTDSPISTVNREFAQQLTMWTFQEVGVVRVDALNHWQVDDYTRPTRLSSVDSKMVNPPIYRVKSDVAFEIELSEWVVDHWEPFVLPEKDELQLEFTMLSPFHRLNLVRNDNVDTKNEGAAAAAAPSTSVFTTAFRTPDQHGIFHFGVNYKRPFLTYVHEKRQVTVRHVAHDEWPRSWTISGAWPWIAGLWSTVVGFLVFSAVWLYGAPPAKLDAVTKSKKKE